MHPPLEERLLLTPTVCALARHLHPRPRVLQVTDRQLASLLGITPDAIYRGLRDLAGHGAVSYTTGPDRTLTRLDSSWVWSWVAQSAGGAL